MFLKVPEHPLKLLCPSACSHFDEQPHPWPNAHERGGPGLHAREGPEHEDATPRPELDEIGDNLPGSEHRDKALSTVR